MEVMKTAKKILVLVLAFSFLGIVGLSTVGEAAEVGLKKRIAVADFEDKSRHSWWSGDNVGTGMSDMLATALMETGRFVVLERQRVGDIIGEQDMVSAGRISKKTGAKTGKIIGAQFMIYGAVTEFEQKERGGGFGFGYKGIGIGVSGSKAHVGVDMRVYDTTTGQIIASKRAVGTCDEKSLALGVSRGGVNFGIGNFQKTPIGKACRKAIEEAVAFISTTVGAIPTMSAGELSGWEGKIIMVKGDKIYINGGSNYNIKSGDEFVVYKGGEKLIDPDTGDVLGTTEGKWVGQIKAISVSEGFSICTAVQGKNFAKKQTLKAVK